MSPLKEIGRIAWDSTLSLIYPEVCQLCNEYRAGFREHYVCQACRGKVRWISAPFCHRCGLPFPGDITGEFECYNCHDVPLFFSRARSAVVANDVLLQAIHLYKYNHVLCFEPFLAELLLERALPELRLEHWSCIVPVPLYGARRREREFNQAERLGRHLAKELNLPMHSRWLKRIVPTETQTRLSREDRMKNVKNAFVMAKGKTLSGEKVILVDDVLTTGATTNACAQVLMDAGAAEVCVWTVARGL
jgi:competence protein ComFC